MDNLQWVFDGIGTEILILIAGAIVGGFAGYKIGIKNGGRQMQKAKSEAKQRQEVNVDNGLIAGGKNKVQSNIRQTQKAGKNSEQVQIGRINNGKQ